MNNKRTNAVQFDTTRHGAEHSLSMINLQFSFEPDETHLWFDELQDFPEIATTLKFFVIDGRS